MKIRKDEESRGTQNLVSRRKMLHLLAAGATAATLPLSTSHRLDAEPASEANAPTMRFGLNYVPRSNWWYAWNDWNAQSIAEDFRAIADLGMDHIRIQCIWPYFQPGINYVSQIAVQRLGEMLDLADTVSLDVEVTVLNGWLSGFAYLPAWVSPLSTAPGRNFFTHPDLIEAQQFLFHSIAAAIGKHRRFLGFDLGNEIGVLSVLDNLTITTTPAHLDTWATRMLAFCDQVAPGKFNINGSDGSGFTRKNLATTGAATVLHCYAYWSGALKLYKYNDAGNLHLLEYMTELAKAYHTDPARGVWIEEVGACGEWMPEDYIPEYTTTLLRNAASCGNIWGFTWWCSHDIDPTLKGFLSLEYTLGVLDLKNRAKPIGRTLSKLAEEMRHLPPPIIARPTAIVIPDHVYDIQEEKRDFEILRHFTSLVKEGHRPAIVLASRVEDEKYLRTRGIRNLVELKNSSQVSGP